MKTDFLFVGNLLCIIWEICFILFGQICLSQGFASGSRTRDHQGRSLSIHPARDDDHDVDDKLIQKQKNIWKKTFLKAARREDTGLPESLPCQYILYRGGGVPCTFFSILYKHVIFQHICELVLLWTIILRCELELLVLKSSACDRLRLARYLVPAPTTFLIFRNWENLVFRNREMHRTICEKYRLENSKAPSDLQLTFRWFSEKWI